MIQRHDRFLDGTTPPDPPAELRGRVLAAAREAMGRVEAPDVWTRIWASRPARFAWAASVAALIFGHVVMIGPVPAGSLIPAMPLTAAAGADQELAEFVDFQRVTVALPGWEVATRPGEALSDQTNQSEDLS